ncbi:hypothetical protein BaRGS_00024730 [Batillaria attramentaria]|uniref:Uncharacterized protein n=1 Tax=Batillaria attramentaria TaxID=370345 RepID=A0ABD0KA90_9CAEN
MSARVSAGYLHNVCTSQCRVSTQCLHESVPGIYTMSARVSAGYLHNVCTSQCRVSTQCLHESVPGIYTMVSKTSTVHGNEREMFCQDRSPEDVDVCVTYAAEHSY